MTKYHRLGDVNSKYLFLIVVEAGKSKFKVPADSVLGERPLPGLQTAVFSLCAHMIEKELITLLSLLIKSLILFTRVPAS